jgi:predicted ATPase
VVRLALRGLDADTVGELVAAVVDDDVPAGVVSVISAETDGNPLFVPEVVLHLLEEGSVGAGAEGPLEPGAELGIPEGVCEAVGRRLTRLSDDTNRLLAVASAFDAGFDLADAAAVSGLDDDASLDAIDDALAARWCVPARGSTAISSPTP